MVTGSHIPFDRNGYKTNTARRELLKSDESPIQERVKQARERVYSQPAFDSLFAGEGKLAGMFKGGSRALPPENTAARNAYLRRYTDFFSGESLKGMRLLVYEHSAVGRDLLGNLLREFGAEVIVAGRSDTFVPIDTENLEESQLAAIQKMAVEAWRKHGVIDAVVSTDGDSDRPLILGVEAAHPSAAGSHEEAPCAVRFFGGDLVGMVVAEFLEPDAVVVPISCNDAIDQGPLKHVLQPKTRIGSPFVIEGMDKARAEGKRAVCGWEANGGFLTGSDFSRTGKVLKALPTRDALLPILGVLFASRQARSSVSGIFRRLPSRFSRAALLKDFPRATSQKILARFTPPVSDIGDLWFRTDQVEATNRAGHAIEATRFVADFADSVKAELERFFTAERGFSKPIRVNYTDGVRIYFENQDVAHVRPSGNADELRIYGVADSQARADEIAGTGVSEPDGILRRLEKATRETPET